MKFRGHRFVFVLVVLVCAAFFIFHALLSEPSNVQTGLSYIEKQENADTDQLNYKLSTIRSQELEKAYQDGKINIFAFYQDYAFFGDSRVTGFSTYGYLDSSRVLAKTGQTIVNIKDWKPQIKKMRPTHLYFSYGVNDIQSNLDESLGGYDTYYEKQIKEILKLCPSGTTVTVNSILPVSAGAEEKNANWKNIDAYNQKIKKMCKRNHWTYIDNDSICDSDSIYEGDGIHFVPSFYQVWAMHMLGL